MRKLLEKESLLSDTFAGNMSQKFPPLIESSQVWFVRPDLEGGGEEREIYEEFI